MARRGTSEDVSLSFLGMYVAGYALWLVYGLTTGSLPLIIVDVAGVLSGTCTLALAVNLHGPGDPGDWRRGGVVLPAEHDLAVLTGGSTTPSQMGAARAYRAPKVCEKFGPMPSGVKRWRMVPSPALAELLAADREREGEPFGGLRRRAGRAARALGPGAVALHVPAPPWSEGGRQDTPAEEREP